MLNACTRLVSRRPCDKWTPPQSGFINVNVDAAVKSHLDFVGIGVCVRDDLGFSGLFQPLF